jgi:hypothetical protein
MLAHIPFASLAFAVFEAPEVEAFAAFDVEALPAEVDGLPVAEALFAADEAFEVEALPVADLEPEVEAFACEDDAAFDGPAKRSVNLSAFSVLCCSLL